MRIRDFRLRYRSNKLTWTSDQQIGKILLRGQVTGHSRAFIAEFKFTLVSGFTFLKPVLVTKRGRVLELVEMSDRVDFISIEPAQDTTELEIELQMRHLSWLEFRYRQVRRIIPVFYRHPREKRLRAGLSVWNVFRDLDFAYGLSCRFRANIYEQGYDCWFEEFHSLKSHDIRRIRRHLRELKNGPRFEVIVIFDADTCSSEREVTISSLKGQIYQNFRMIDATIDTWRDVISSHDALMMTRPDTSVDNVWRLVVRSGVQLAPHTLYWFASVAIELPESVVIYADEDSIAPSGQKAYPVFKPEWSREHLLATNYIGEAFAWKASALNDQWQSTVTDTSSFRHILHSLLLSITAGVRVFSSGVFPLVTSVPASSVAHVASPLWHIPQKIKTEDRDVGFAAEKTASLVQLHLSQRNINAQVFPIEFKLYGNSTYAEPVGPAACHVRYALPQPAPRVSILIPTRDGLEHLKPCIDSILSKTTYPDYEVIIMDNQSVLPETLAYFAGLNEYASVTVISFDEPFNYSRINNVAAANAKGEYLCLLNNDTEIISRGWLEDMVGILGQTHVGAVGAKLLFADGSVQHAGDTVGPGGCADHLHSGLARDDLGYMGRAVIAQDFSAVTGACLLTKSALFHQLGGLDECNLPVAFNDVDFCLRLREAGYSVLWTPHALLHHHESVSRGKDVSPEQLKRSAGEVAYMRERWGKVMEHDPFYNSNLNYLQPDFELSATPNVKRPWLSR